MENNPLVSIIIPAYNSSSFIPETLKCVIDQTYDHLECLIIDDGSTDNLKAVVKPFLEKYPFIKYIYQENKGLSSARNMGFSNTGGKYIQFLDADDLILPNKIKEQVSILENNSEIGVSYTNYRPFNSDTGELLDRYSHLIVEANPLEDFLFKWERGLSIPIHSALFRKSIWEVKNIFNEQLEAKEDWEMWVSISLKGTKFHFLDKDYALYRMHNENMCKDEMKMLSLFLKASHFISETLPAEYKDRFIVETKDYVFNSLKSLLYLNKDISYASFNTSVSDEHLISIINSPEWKIISTYYKFRKSVMPDGSRRKAFFRRILKLFRNPRGTINDLRIKSYITLGLLKGPEKFRQSSRYDVIFFPVIEWDFRNQRPQQIATRFARNGHRVLYVNINLRKTRSYSTKVISENIYDISLPFNENTSIYNKDISAEYETISSALDAIFKDFSIQESVAFVEFPLWAPVTGYLKNKYQTKIIFDCLDEFSGFTDINCNINQIEDNLLMLSDFCITSSLKLYDKHKDKCKNISLISNGIGPAKTNDWNSKFIEISNVIKNSFPLVSIIILTFNNLKYTKLCVESIFAKTAYPNFELIIVDNASSDETQDYLRRLKDQYDNIKIILNKENLGFAVSNNIGIKESKGEYIILLNNDTVVTGGWLTGLTGYLQKSEVGIVGPVTNSIANEAKISVDYKDISEMDRFAESYTSLHRGKTFEIGVLAMFCLAVRRETVEKVGLLDEQFTIGMFEDDDYALRIKQAGLKIICAEDIFIHHFGGASFSLLGDKEYMKIFEDNRRRFENKWDTIWNPHRYRNGVSDI